MGGFENYGHEELYIEDTWDDVKPDFKPKVSDETKFKCFIQILIQNTNFLCIGTIIFSGLQIRAVTETKGSTVGVRNKSIRRMLIIITIKS